MTASISRSSFAQTRSCACLLDLFIVWHAYFPVTPGMFRPCLHVVFSCSVECLACLFSVHDITHSVTLGHDITHLFSVPVSPYCIGVSQHLCEQLSYLMFNFDSCIATRAV